MKKYIIIIIGISILLTAYHVEAASIIREQNLDGYTGSVGVGTGGWQVIGSGLTGNYDSLTLETTAAATTTLYFNLFAATSSATSTLAGSDFIQNLVAEKYVTIPTGHSFITITSSTSLTTSSSQFDPQKYYFFTFSAYAGGNFSIYGDTQISSYAYGQAYGNSWNSFDGLNNLWFELNATNQTPLTLLTFPYNNLSTPDFKNWITTTFSGSNGVIHIRYGNDPNNLNYDDNTAFNAYSADQQTSIPKSINLSLQQSYNATTSWYAQPYLVIGTTTYYGATYNFTYDGNATATNPQAILNPIGNLFTTPSSTSNLANCSIIEVGGCFVNAFQAIISFMFQPSTAITTPLSQQIIQFTTIFPFSIPATILNYATQNVNTSIATSTTINIPFMPAYSSTTIPFLNNNTLSNTIGSTAYNTYFNIMRSFLYLGTGAVMFYNITSIL